MGCILASVLERFEAILMGFGCQVGKQHRPKIDPKMESKMECISASIFERFCWILGPNLGRKIQENSMSEYMNKISQVEERLEDNLNGF